MATILAHFDYEDLPKPKDRMFLNIPARIVFFSYAEYDYLDIKLEDSPGVSASQMVRVERDELKELFSILLSYFANDPELLTRHILEHLPKQMHREILHNLIDRI